MSNSKDFLLTFIIISLFSLSLSMNWQSNEYRINWIISLHIYDRRVGKLANFIYFSCRKSIVTLFYIHNDIYVLTFFLLVVGGREMIAVKFIFPDKTPSTSFMSPILSYDIIIYTNVVSTTSPSFSFESFYFSFFDNFLAAKKRKQLGQQ